MGAVKSVGRVFKPSRAPTLPKHPVRSSPQPSSGGRSASVVVEACINNQLTRTCVSSC